MPVEELADVLWGADAPASWETALRAVVSKLRTALGQAGVVDAVVAEGGCYQLRVPGAWVDVEEAVRSLHRAERARRAGDLASAWSAATVAASITGRPVLPGSLMRCRLAAGDRAEAPRVYADCRSLLAEELGVEPAAETAGVYLEALAAGG